MSKNVTWQVWEFVQYCSIFHISFAWLSPCSTRAFWRDGGDNFSVTGECQRSSRSGLLTDWIPERTVSTDRHKCFKYVRITTGSRLDQLIVRLQATTALPWRFHLTGTLSVQFPKTWQTACKSTDRFHNSFSHIISWCCQSRAEQRRCSVFVLFVSMLFL